VLLGRPSGATVERVSVGPFELKVVHHHHLQLRTRKNYLNMAL
jgi:hypothetical protein